MNPRTRITMAAVLAAVLLWVPNLGARHAQAATTIIKNVEYANVGGVSLKLDVYEPSGPGPFPGLVFIYGGQYWSRDKCLFGNEGRKLAANGLTTYVIDYRLAPRLASQTSVNCPDGSIVDISQRQGYIFDFGVQDSLTAVDWVRQHAALYKTDPTRVSALGSSSGANFAYMLGTKGVVQVEAGWSGVTKFDSRFSNSVVQNYIGCSLASCPQTWSDASPLDQVGPTTAPAAIYNGSNETIPSYMATDYGDKLTAQGIVNQTTVMNTNLHGIHYENLVLANGRTVLQDTADFIKAHD